MDSMFTKMGALFALLYVVYSTVVGVIASGLIYIVCAIGSFAIPFSLWIPVLVCGGIGVVVGLIVFGITYAMGKAI